MKKIWNHLQKKKKKKTSKETVKNVNYVNLVLDASAATEKNQPKVILVAIVEQMILISKTKASTH